MRLVNIAYVVEGSVLARPLIAPNGKVLLQAGITLSRSYIDKLARLGLDTMFIEDATFEDVEITSAVSLKTREVAYAAILNLSKNIDESRLRSGKLDGVKNAVRNIIGDLLDNKGLLGNIIEIQGHDDYTFHHSVNTTIIALLMGISMGWSDNKLFELGMGVLMHDVGKIKIPEEIFNKVGPLTLEEFDEIKKHSEYGFQILRKNRDINIVSAHVALQHQERWDGSGYPRGLKGTQIHEYARVTAVADVYEALTSKRIYRNAHQPYEAYEYLIANSDWLFEPLLVQKVFPKCITPYPTGTGVRLSNGQRGNVVKQNPNFPTRPYVRMTHDFYSRLFSPIDYNLVEHPSLMIVGIENR
ncbi:HD-GYP domain-containing protein [Desulfitobacterium dichloroeliminans LMG P-21439]|uniref:HD-GYP domain-containing protein n=1 Tax=Desulfitobacterium dichloroeliminans (strain LMG P-21439 / DCA1) TaxID=871963 RepID=L0F6Z3_DESDL|nr:HD-GYP domain-containing protein [Desulfitobacterium dichloroeliminans]AGA68957.1 HD-GYP domain-containing protein [Desulfitobacterium dichloroeliminans LMG P-21439]